MIGTKKYFVMSAAVFGALGIMVGCGADPDGSSEATADPPVVDDAVGGASAGATTDPPGAVEPVEGTTASDADSSTLMLTGQAAGEATFGAVSCFTLDDAVHMMVATASEENENPMLTVQLDSNHIGYGDGTTALMNSAGSITGLTATPDQLIFDRVGMYEVDHANPDTGPTTFLTGTVTCTEDLSAE